MPGQGTYAPMYAQPVAPVAPVAPVPMGAFEPGDPIPETPIEQAPTENTDRKHRPRFVDYFMKRNNEDK